MKKYGISFLIIGCLLLGCTPKKAANNLQYPTSEISLAILGIAQDAGYPQTGCLKPCCTPFREGKEKSRAATAIAIIDKSTQQNWLFEASPDIKKQLYELQILSSFETVLPAGIFLTHAHIGHYTGLMHFGHEAMGTKSLPVFAMPRMTEYLTQNGPWSQLVTFQNIALQPLHADSTIQLTPKIKVTPFLVPHRDEYSETVGYTIEIPNKKIVFIPDINKWEKWEKDILSVIKNCDLALLDGTFYKNGELPNRDMSQIPHPFVEESLAIFEGLPKTEKQKIVFIHFNHTNPLLRDTEAYNAVRNAGFGVAREGMIF